MVTQCELITVVYDNYEYNAKHLDKSGKYKIRFIHISGLDIGNL